MSPCVHCTHLCASTHYTVGGSEISGLRILLVRASLMLGPSGVSHPSLWGLAHVLHHATCQLAHMNHQGPLQSAPTCSHIAHLVAPNEACIISYHLQMIQASQMYHQEYGSHSGHCFFSSLNICIFF